MNTPTARPKLTKEQTLVLGILTSKARGKKHYAAAAAKLAELKALSAPGKTVDMADGRRFMVADTFAAIETAKKMVFIDRYELQELKG